MSPSADDDRFIAAMGSMMERWGLPQATGRLYGYLLLSNEPVDLDTMVRDLGSSKSGLSVAARQLESWFLIRRIPSPGSRRVCFEVDGDTDQLLRVNSVQLQRFSDTLRQGAATATGRASSRLDELSQLFEVYVSASVAAIAGQGSS
jgi:DNA-binding transcriptional regulator GbsR (MarR family)